MGRVLVLQTPINIREAEGPGLSIPPTPGPMGRIPDPVGPADVSAPLVVIFFLILLFQPCRRLSFYL